MTTYKLPKIDEPILLNTNEAILVASGDLRLSANQTCWPAQAEMENKLAEAFEAEGWKIIRGHDYDPVEKHGFPIAHITAKQSEAFVLLDEIQKGRKNLFMIVWKENKTLVKIIFKRCFRKTEVIFVH